MPMPNVMLVAGNTDYLSPTKRSVDFSLDSALRSVARTYNVNAWRTAVGSGTRKCPAAGRLYAEFSQNVYHADMTGTMFGLTLDGLEGSGMYGNYVTSVAGGTYGYSGGGTLTESGAVISTGNAVFSYLDRLGLLMYRDEGGVDVVRFIKNGRYNILAYSEELDNAAWTKGNSAKASGQYLTFVTNTSYIQQNIGACGGVGSQFTISFYVTSSHTMSFNTSLRDSADSVPSVDQANAVTAGVRTLVTMPATLGVGYSGSLAVIIYGNATAIAGSVVKIEELQVNAGLYRDPYQKQTTASGGYYCGNPRALVAGSSYRLAISGYYPSIEYSIHPDRDDFIYLPSGAVPWGAAARVADFGGYSLDASKFDLRGLPNSPVIDKYGRVITASVNGTGNTAYSTTRTYSDACTDLVYCEYEVEAIDGNDIEIGLAKPTRTTSGYLGSDALSWGYSYAGNLWHNSAATATGITFGLLDRPGFIWQPSSGKVWFTKNGTPLSGSPTAGTGAHYTNVTGGFMRPGASVWTTTGVNGRVRLCSHLSEQVYCPTYCRSWDGSNVLPSMHFRGVLQSNPEIRESLSLYAWANNKASGSPVGSVDISNVDGFYDNMATGDLRDQRLTIYEASSVYPNSTEWVATVNIDDAQFIDDKTMRILPRGVDSFLDKRVSSQVFAIGGLNRAPARMKNASTLLYEIEQAPFLGVVNVYDMALSVSTWKHAPFVDGEGHGIFRTINPVGKQAASALIYRSTGELTITNNDFTTWTADNPNNWTITETAPNSLVTQSGTAARFLRNAGAANCRAKSDRNMARVASSGGHTHFVKVVVTAYVAGDLCPAADMGGFGVTIFGTGIGITGPGTYYFGFSFTTGFPGDGFFMLHANDTTDLTVDSVNLYTVESTQSFAPAMRYLLEDVCGLSSSAYTLPTDTLTRTPGISYWSDRQPTIREVVDEICKNYHVSYYTSPKGLLTFVQMPEIDTSTSVLTLEEIDALDALKIERDRAPNLSNQAIYSPTYNPHSDTEIAAAVSATDRSYVTRGHYINKLASGGGSWPIHQFYTHALGATPTVRAQYGSYSSNPTDADPAADSWLIRVHKWYSKLRDFLSRTYRADRVSSATLGRVVTVRAARFNLAVQGRKVVVVERTRSLLSPTVKMKFWG